MRFARPAHPSQPQCTCNRNEVQTEEGLEHDIQQHDQHLKSSKVRSLTMRGLNDDVTTVILSACHISVIYCLMRVNHHLNHLCKQFLSRETCASLNIGEVMCENVRMLLRDVNIAGRRVPPINTVRKRIDWPLYQAISLATTSPTRLMPQHMTAKAIRKAMNRLDSFALWVDSNPRSQRLLRGPPHSTRCRTILLDSRHMYLERPMTWLRLNRNRRLISLVLHGDLADLNSLGHLLPRTLWSLSIYHHRATEDVSFIEPLLTMGLEELRLYGCVDSRAPIVRNDLSDLLHDSPHIPYIMALDLMPYVVLREIVERGSRVCVESTKFHPDERPICERYLEWAGPEAVM